jgi:hypothetical protein
MVKKKVETLPETIYIARDYGDDESWFVTGGNPEEVFDNANGNTFQDPVIAGVYKLVKTVSITREIIIKEKDIK